MDQSQPTRPLRAAPKAAPGTSRRRGRPVVTDSLTSTQVRAVSKIAQVTDKIASIDKMRDQAIKERNRLVVKAVDEHNIAKAEIARAMKVTPAMVFDILKKAGSK